MTWADVVKGSVGQRSAGVVKKVRLFRGYFLESILLAERRFILNYILGSFPWGEGSRFTVLVRPLQYQELQISYRVHCPTVVLAK